MSESEKSSIHNFVSAINNEVQQGYGVIPLTGAGISVPSGVPTADRLAVYLREVLRVIENEKAEDRSSARPHDGSRPSFEVSFKFWPDMPTILSTPNPTSIDKDGYMLLLHRIASALEVSSEEVFDSFFTFLTSGKKPSEAHRMLAQLITLLGGSVMFTLNFDDLQEQAFQELRLPLQVYEVPTRGSLPRYASASETSTLIKLHGGKVSVVAGNEVNKLPSVDDLQQFCAYFTDGNVREIMHSVPSGRVRQAVNNHLLVMGFAGKDARIVRFIKTLLEETEAKVFWVGYTPNDEEEIKHAFSEYSKQSRLHCVHYYDIGLILLHLYQRICFCLPSSGVWFPGSMHLPLPPYPATDTAAEQEGEMIKLEQTFKKRNGPHTVLYGSAPKANGVMSVASRFFHHTFYDMPCVCIWLDVHEPYNIYACFYDVYTTLIRRTGTALTLPCRITENGESSNELEEMLAKTFLRTRMDVYVVLNFRTEYKHATHRTADVINAIVRLQARISEQRKISENRKDKKHNLRFLLLLRLHGSQLSNYVQDRVEYKLLEKKFSALNNHRKLWDDADEGKRFFLYGLSLFRRSVHFSALTSRALFPHLSEIRDRERGRKAMLYVEELQKTNRVRIKRGGFVWMLPDLRVFVQDQFEKSIADRGLLIQIRRSIADWYHKLYYASGDCMAALEGLHFRIEIVDKLLDRASNYDFDSNEHAAYIYASCSQATYILRYAKESLLGHENKIVIYETLLNTKKMHDAIVQRAKRSTRVPLEFLSVEISQLLMELGRMVGRQDIFNLHVKQASLPVNMGDRNTIFADLQEESQQGLMAVSNGNFSIAKDKIELTLNRLSKNVPQQTFWLRKSDYSTSYSIIVNEGRWLPAMNANGLPAASQAELRFVLVTIRRYMQVLMEELHLAEGLAILSVWPKKHDQGAESIYIKADAIYAKLRELRRYILSETASGFLLREAFRIRTLQAQILAQQGRPLEAHRRLSEALSNLQYCSRHYDQGYWAEYELGRCDVLLHGLEILMDIRGATYTTRWCGVDNNGPLLIARRGARLLNAAAGALRRAEDLLKSSRGSVYWWSKYSELRLRIALCAEIYCVATGTGVLSTQVQRLRTTESVKSALSYGCNLSKQNAYTRARLLVLAKTLETARNTDLNTQGILAETPLSLVNVEDDGTKAYIEKAIKYLTGKIKSRYASLLNLT